MTAEQFAKLLELLGQIVINQRHYALTEAVDWPMLVCVGGIVFSLLAYIWYRVNKTIDDQRAEMLQLFAELKEDYKQQKEDHRNQIERLWNIFTDCQNNCCPRGKWDGIERRGG